MTIFLDDQPLELAGSDLGAVLEAAGGQLRPRRRMVVEVRWDGRTLRGDELQEHCARPVGGVEVRLYSAEPGALALAALRQLRELLGHSAGQLRQAAEGFQADQADQAMRLMAQGLDVWQQLPQALMHAAALTGVDPDSLDPPADVSAMASGLAQRLRSLRDQVEAHDTVGLADALAYEWPGVVERWDQVVCQIIARIEAQA